MLRHRLHPTTVAWPLHTRFVCFLFSCMYYLIICFPCLHSTSLRLSVTLVFNDTPTMKFATLVIFACLKCVTVKSQGSLRVEDKSSNKATTAAELTQVYDPKINDDAIVNADERAEVDWGLKSSVREAMVCTPLWYINCDGVCVMSCEEDIGGSCGGHAKPWDTLFDRKSVCCEKKLTHLLTCHSTSRSFSATLAWPHAILPSQPLTILHQTIRPQIHRATQVKSPLPPSRNLLIHRATQVAYQAATP